MKLLNFIDRLRKNPNGETVRVEEGLRGLENGYFRKIGQYFKTAQILLFVVLFLFVTVFALVNAESVTYRNLYYFVKDFRTAVDNTDTTASGIAYEADPNASYASFKGGLAVAGRERLQLLTAAGGVNASEVIRFNAPALSATTDLLLVYARGENTCHLYNSFAKLHTETMEYAVRTAYLSESGAYSVTTGDADFESAVYVYSRRFRKLNKYNLNSYVVSAPLSDNGKTVAILSYAVTEGVYETRLRLAEVGSEKVYCDYMVAGDYPLGVAFMDNDTVLMLTSGGLHIATEKNGGVALESFGGAAVGAFAFDETGAAVVLVTDGDRAGVLKAYTADGEERIAPKLSAPVRELKMLGDSVFYRTDTELCRLDLGSGEISSLSCAAYGGTIVPVSEDRILLCESGAATYYRFP